MKYSSELEYYRELKTTYSKEMNQQTETKRLISNAGPLLKEKERDWAIAGGIANGIAGPAAGVASAIDAQLHNQRVRENNALIDKNLVAMGMYLSQKRFDTERKIDEVQKKIEELEQARSSEINQYKRKVLGEEDDDKVFDYVDIDDVKYSVTSLGSVLVKIVLHKNKQCNVYGNPHAHVDGSFIAKIFQNNYLIGIADLVLPLEGLRGSVTLQGISRCNATDHAQCTVEIIPKNLWVVED